MGYHVNSNLVSFVGIFINGVVLVMCCFFCRAEQPIEISR